MSATGPRFRPLPAKHEHAHPDAAGHTHEHSQGKRSHEQAHAYEPGTRNAALVRDAGKGQVLYLDAGSGLAGDMLVAALIDLGVPEAVIRQGLAGLPVGGYNVTVQRVERSGIAARHFEVTVQGEQPSRDYGEIRTLLGTTPTLSRGARELALAAFARLAQAEAQVHDTTPDAVHFHEVGAVDSIVDITAAAIGFDYLGARVVCSPLPMGRGVTRSAHGLIPLPAPATVLCLAGVPTCDASIAEELVTPTGACLVATVSNSFGGWPSMRTERCGYGAGTKELADRPNLLRVVLGREDLAAAQAVPAKSTHVVVETNVDDMSAEIAAYAMSAVLAAGALDAWTTPIGMKKGRSALMLSALIRPEMLDSITRVLLSETGSLGLRHYPVQRIERPRHMVEVDTSYGVIAVKVAEGDGLPTNAAPEYEACRQAAEAHCVPVRQVYAAAIAAYQQGTSRG